MRLQFKTARRVGRRRPINTDLPALVPGEGLETHGRTPCGLGVRPRGRRELRWIEVAPRRRRTRDPAGPLFFGPSKGLLLNSAALLVKSIRSESSQ